MSYTHYRQQYGVVYKKNCPLNQILCIFPKSGSNMPESDRHLLVLPYPAQGHLLALLDFLHQIAARTAGKLPITVVVTPKNVPILTPLLSAHPNSVTTLVLPFPHHPNIPAGIENTVHLPASGFLQMMSALAQLRDPIVDWFNNHPTPPTAIISDMFVGWSHHLARDLGIRSYAFFPSGVFSMSFVYSLWCEMPERDEAVSEKDQMVGFSDIPNSPIYPWCQLSPLFRSYVEGDPVSEFIKDSLLANFRVSDGIVFNTFEALEGVCLDYLVKKLGHNRVWTMGPILPPDNLGPIERGGPSSISVIEISSWLDTCKDRSVVYVCFGSQAVLTNEQMEALALGLEKSGVKFILSVKSATKGLDEAQYGAVPLGFEDRVAGRGLLIKGWAPQVLILRHRAVCGFLTHCGWNSVLESIVAGVPMLAWPMNADQYLNATLLADQMGVAVRVCEGGETVLPSDDLVAILEQISGAEWGKRIERAAALRKEAFAATNEGGSSFNNLGDLIKQLS